MECMVISISRTLGAGGEEIGRDVAARLGFRFVDEEIVAQAAEKAGVSPDKMAQVERTAPLIQRILKQMGTTAVEPAGYVPPPSHTTPGYEALIEQVIRETAALGNVVILAHGASIPLAAAKGVVRVLITGSPESRAVRLYGQSSDIRKARKTVEDSDRERSRYLERFYGIGTELPTHYDMVLNTDVLPLSVAADAIVAVTQGG